MRTKIATAGVIVLAAFAIACGSGGDGEAPTSGLPADAQDSTAADGASGADLAAKVTFEDGLVVYLADMKRGTSAEYAIPDKSPFVSFKLTIENGTGSDIDLALVTIDCATGADGDQAEQVYDSENDLGMGIQGVVKDGKKKSAVYGCVMDKKVTELQVEVSVNDDFTRESAVFTGEVPA